MEENKYKVLNKNRYWVIQPVGGGLPPMELRSKYLSEGEAHRRLLSFLTIQEVNKTKRKKRVRSKTKPKKEEKDA